MRPRDSRQPPGSLHPLREGVLSPKQGTGFRQGCSESRENVDAKIWPHLTTGSAGISVVGEHQKNELKIGNDQARGINLVFGPARRRGASCPNHPAVGWCQCPDLPAGAQSVSPVKQKPHTTARVNPRRYSGSLGLATPTLRLTTGAESQVTSLRAKPNLSHESEFD